MKKAERHIPLAMVLCLLAACHGDGGQAGTTSAPARAAAHAPAHATADADAVPDTVERWEQLAPANDIYQRPPPRISTAWRGDAAVMDQPAPVDDGPSVVNGMPIDHSGTQRAAQFGSSQVVKGLEGKRFALDGYVVPLESDDQGKVSELLFVPFYGACIHVPPPPPNQILHVVLRTPIDLPELWDPFHLQGRLHLADFKAVIANATYEAEDATITPVQG
ncbi:DUF3299 domain-containing protein [Xanthomonas indica]|uniref:DUF3299 domain-containing protein n=1 Tax=Xanthomonas indica TaxID=2912242 RepID=A0AAU8I1M0_9XANT|nr:DUF3299 domain-containing protein [Xanthomonas indica]MCI2260784.1 DUF3299 domain-containing protein [Xanthomonas indica]